MITQRSATLRWSVLTAENFFESFAHCVVIAGTRGPSLCFVSPFWSFFSVVFASSVSRRAKL